MAVLPERNLKALLLRHLREERSISALARRLAEDGVRLHRLFLSGYLKAMADGGLLRAKPIPPALVFVAAGSPEEDIYQVLGERIAAMRFGDERRCQFAIFTLQRLFKRPVFLEELRRCGIVPPPVLRHMRVVTGDEREDARRMVTASGLSLPHNDPAHRSLKEFKRQYAELLGEIVLGETGGKALRMGTKQSRLEV